METLKSSKAIAVVATTLFVVSIFWLINTKRVNNSLEAGLHDQKLQSEELLSEKLLLEKDIRKAKEQLAVLREQNYDLDDLYKNASAQLNDQESSYNRMKRENASLSQIKKHRQELVTIQSTLENEIGNLRAAQADLEAKNAELDRMVVSLGERNRILTEDLNKTMFATLDQSQIHAVKRNSEKLTVKASRTKKIIANFQVPSGLEKLGFRITDSGGYLLTQNDGTIGSTVTPFDNSFAASSNSETQGNKLQKVEMTYIPKKKLGTGVYTVEILNENLHVGSLKVKLK